MAGRHNIAHLITRLELGGAQQNTLFCTAHHDRELFDVTLLAGPGGMLDAEARKIDDARVEWLPYLRHPIRPIHDLIALLRLRSKFKAERNALVHTHSSKAGIVGRLAAHLAGVPVVVHTVHGWSFNDTQPAWLRRLYVTLERLAARLTTKLIVVAPADREKGLRLGIGRAEQYALLHSGIDLDAFGEQPTDRDALRASLGFDRSHTVVGCVANFKPQKAPLDFVEAAAAAAAERDDLRFFIAGDGDLRPRAEARARELGLEGKLRFLGWRTDVEHLFQAMDIFFLTSLFEGLPRTVLQAMAAGVPVVATSVNGTADVVEHGVTGLLAPPADPRTAASRVVEMASSRELRDRCANEARGRMTRDFDIHSMVEDLDALYVALLSRAGL